MRRKRVIIQSDLKSWDDVNETLRQIAELKSSLDGKVAIYNEDEARRRKELDEFCNPLRAKIELLEEEMKLFCEEHRVEFGNRKSKDLANGQVGFRLGTPKAKTLRGFTWNAVLNLIKRSIYKENYLRQKEEVNKEQIIIDHQTKTITNDDLRSIGIEVIQEETFGYELHIASEQQAAA